MRGWGALGKEHISFMLPRSVLPTSSAQVTHPSPGWKGGGQRWMWRKPSPPGKVEDLSWEVNTSQNTWGHPAGPASHPEEKKQVADIPRVWSSSCYFPLALCYNTSLVLEWSFFFQWSFSIAFQGGGVCAGENCRVTEITQQIPDYEAQKVITAGWGERRQHTYETKKSFCFSVCPVHSSAQTLLALGPSKLPPLHCCL